VSGIGTAAGVDVPPAAAAAITGGLHTLQAVANGQKPDVAVLNSAVQAVPGIAKGINFSTDAGIQEAADRLIDQGQKMIPKLSADQRKNLDSALKIGIAVQHAANLQKLQQAAVPNTNVSLMTAGQKALDAVSQAALESLHGIGTNGFMIGHGLVQNQATGSQIAAARKGLSLPDQHGFDVATALHLGRVVAPVIVHLPPPAQAGYAATIGAAIGRHPKAKEIVATVAASPAGAAGAKAALAQLRKTSWLLDAGIVAGGLVLGVLTVGGSTGAVIGTLIGGGVDLIRRKVRS
jgi:hypothetical protein